jgi:hypothetical protein
MALWTSIAQRTASTTLRNSMIEPSPVHSAPVMRGDGRVDQIAAKAPEPRERAILVSASEPAVAEDIRHQNRREFSALAHGALRPPAR